MTERESSAHEKLSAKIRKAIADGREAEIISATGLTAPTVRGCGAGARLKLSSIVALLLWTDNNMPDDEEP